MRARLVSIVTVLALTVSPAALAQVVRTWVSAVNGNDANPCTRTQPCRNFGAAVDAVDAGGEVVVLDSGGYGAVTITKSVSIISPAGIHAAIAPTNDQAIQIEDPLAEVTLRNLYLNSQGAPSGITVDDVAILHLEGVVVSDFGLFGIFFHLQTAGGELYIKDSISRNNGSGLRLATAVGTAAAFVDRSRFENNSRGIEIIDRGRADIRESVFTGNFFAGADVAPIFDATTAILNADACTFSGNDDGVRISKLTPIGNSFAAISNSLISSNSGSGVIVRMNGTVRLTGNLVTGNVTGLNNAGGTMESAGDNAVRGNTAETSGAMTPFSPI